MLTEAAVVISIAVSIAAFWSGGPLFPPLTWIDAAAAHDWMTLVQNRTLSDSHVKDYHLKGHLLITQAVPRNLIEKLLLPKLSTIDTPRWARWLLPHLQSRFQAVTYGLSLQHTEVKHFWAYGPAASLVAPLFKKSNMDSSVVLLADAYYSVAPNFTGLPRHMDAKSSYCMVALKTPGISFWLALDDASADTGGSIEICDLSSTKSNFSDSCRIYDVRRGDVILFSKHALHRTVPFAAQDGMRRALVGRFVPSTARLQNERAPPELIHANGFDGQYLCKHGLYKGSILYNSACFPKVGPQMMAVQEEALQLRSPLVALSELASRPLFQQCNGTVLTQALALALTLVVELSIVHVWWCLASLGGESFLRWLPTHRGRLMATSAAATLLTHPCVWFWSDVLFAHATFTIRVTLIEALITAAEAGMLFGLGGTSCGPKQTPRAVMHSLVLSLVMNFASANFGFVLDWACYLHGGHFSISTTAVSWSLGCYLVVKVLTTKTT